MSPVVLEIKTISSSHEEFLFVEAVSFLCLSLTRFLCHSFPELSEDWSCLREPVIDGVPFYAKYLGSSIVQKPSGEEATADAIKTIIAMVRQKKGELFQSETLYIT